MTEKGWVPADNDPIQDCLGKIRTSLQTLSTSENSDAVSLKKELAVIVKQLDDILQSIKTEGLGMKHRQQNSALDSDMEREMGRIRQTLKPDTHDPHRID